MASLLRYLGVCALLMFTEAQAAGLRGVEVGDSCGMAADSESRRGSRPVSGDPGPGLRYRGEHSGMNAEIVYLCRNDKLQDQLIVMTAPDRDTAYRVAGELKRAVADEYGAPQYDVFASGYLQRVWYSLWGVSGDVMSQSAVWQQADREVFLWVRSTTGDGWPSASSARWEVRLSQSAHATLIIDGYRGID